MGHLAPGEIFENMLQLKRFGLYFEGTLNQGRQTRQNSGGVADLTKEGLQNFFDFYAIKISTF